MSRLLAALLLALPLCAHTGEPLRLAIAPHSLQGDARAHYQPLIDLLEQTLGRPVAFDYSNDWNDYLEGIAGDRYDIILDEPHLMAWRQVHHGHEALVVVDQPHGYFVVKRKDRRDIVDISDMAGKRICVTPPPTLAALSLRHLFANPARQPFLVHQNTPVGSYTALHRGECDGAVVPVRMLTNLADLRSTRNTHILYQTELLPGPGASASRRLDAAERTLVRTALQGARGGLVLANLLPGLPGPVGARRCEAREFSGLEDLLQDEVRLEAMQRQARLTVTPGG